MILHQNPIQNQMILHQKNYHYCNHLALQPLQKYFL
nr:MAG TPA: hypothetical protein [Caudoviricetes sp.]